MQLTRERARSQQYFTRAITLTTLLRPGHKFDISVALSKPLRSLGSNSRAPFYLQRCCNQSTHRRHNYYIPVKFVESRLRWRKDHAMAAACVRACSVQIRVVCRDWSRT